MRLMFTDICTYYAIYKLKVEWAWAVYDRVIKKFKNVWKIAIDLKKI